MAETKTDSWLDLACALQFADPCSRIHSKLVITWLGSRGRGRGIRGYCHSGDTTVSSVPDCLDEAFSEILTYYFKRFKYKEKTPFYLVLNY